MNKCDDCRFWVSMGYIGDCRRHAPVAMTIIIGRSEYLDDTKPEGRWPKTSDTDGCGDWEPKERE